MKSMVLCLAASVAAACAMAMLAAQPAQAQTYKVLYNFCSAKNCTDGRTPYAGVIRDAKGNLYGTTAYGGDSTYIGGGGGTIFKLSETGKETVLYSFCRQSGCADGAYPYAGIIQDEKGNLYGATTNGGGSSACNGGCGTVFELSKRGKETVLYSFKGGSDGSLPSAGVIRDAQGNLYGTTEWGGTGCGGSGCGVVFKLDTAGKETVLYSFCSQSGCADGSNPFAGVIRDATGNLYGTTVFGGQAGCFKNFGCGVVFKLDPTGKQTVLYNFMGGTDGGNPEAGVIRDANGDLYGTTAGYFYGDGYDFGTAFKLSKKGEETVLCQFPCSEGAFPYAGVIRDAKGNIYGTTSSGGGGTGCGAGFGCGVLFKLDTTGKETVLYTFCSQPGCADGASPYAEVIHDEKGNLYGTTSAGGANNCGGYPCGTVFELTP